MPAQAASTNDRGPLFRGSSGNYWISAFPGMMPRNDGTKMSNQNKSKAPSQRQLKVGELIRHALAEIFQRGEIVDDVLGRHSLTVPEVRMTPDLKLATIYVLPLGGGEADEAVAHLDKHKRYLRGLLAKKVEMKFIPELRFRVDTTFEDSSRIDALLASPKVARDLDS